MIDMTRILKFYKLFNELEKKIRPFDSIWFSFKEIDKIYRVFNFFIAALILYISLCSRSLSPIYKVRCSKYYNYKSPFYNIKDPLGKFILLLKSKIMF